MKAPRAKAPLIRRPPSRKDVGAHGLLLLLLLLLLVLLVVLLLLLLLELLLADGRGGHSWDGSGRGGGKH